MASKRFKGKTCAYCGAIGASSEGDHIIARAFFLETDRRDLPQVPACRQCNNTKSSFETYVSALLPLASLHVDADIIRSELVAPRLVKNAKLQRQLSESRQKRWKSIKGIYRPTIPVKVNVDMFTALMGMMSLGFHYHHFNQDVAPDTFPDVEPIFNATRGNGWEPFSKHFPIGCSQIHKNWGRGVFEYSGWLSVRDPSLSKWRMRWHNGAELRAPNKKMIDTWEVTMRPLNNILY